MHILIGPNHHNLEQVIPELKARHPNLTFTVAKDRAHLVEQLADAEAYIGWLSRDEFLAARKLRWIQSPSTGVDSFLRIPELRDSGVILTNARGVHAAPLAEQTFAMIFGFTRGMKVFLEHQQRHEWAGRDARDGLVELTGSTMGIVGYGTVGQAIAERALAFGMQVLAVDVLPGEKADRGVQVGGLGELDELLERSDYVVITVPLTEQTRGMIGAEQVALMKPSTMLIGISRGGIIQEDALAEALTSGKLACAALDVFETEPLPADSPLWDMENLIVLPHAAGGTQYEAASLRAIFAENVDRFVRGDFPLRNEVGKLRGF
jgi:phosphoglycerate dehydrogenase-like enzyme